MESNTLYILLGSAVFTLFLGILLLSKSNKGLRLYRRAAFLLIGILSILLLIIEPGATTQIPNRSAHLITDDSEIPDSIEYAFTNIHDLLTDPAYHLTDTIIIHGTGLKYEDLDLVKEIPILWQVKDSGIGIIEMDPNRYYVNENSTIRGRFTGPVAGISLRSSNDERFNASLQDSTFEISWRPRSSGEQLYTIDIIGKSGDTITEKMPFYVYPEAKWQLLALMDYPSSEFNQLKNYWTELGYGMAVSTRISKDRYHRSFTNLETLNIEKINIQLLRRFDLLFLHARSWNKLLQFQRQAILNQVSNAGLGLILLEEEGSLKLRELSVPPSTEMEITELNNIRLQSKLHTRRFNENSNWSTLSFDNNSISTIRSYGLGKILVMGLNDSYKLKLQGRIKEYQQIWSSIFSSIFTDFNTDNVLLKPDWILAEEALELELILDVPADELLILHNDVEVQPLQTAFIKDHYNIKVRPKAGLNIINVEPSGDVFSYYAHPDDTWQAMREYRFTSHLEAINNYPKRQLQKQYEKHPFSSFWWFLLFLIGFGLLWLDERIWN